MKSEEWMTGRYLRRGGWRIEAAAHTPKNFFGADKRGWDFWLAGVCRILFAPRLIAAERSGLEVMGVEDYHANICRRLDATP